MSILPAKTVGNPPLLTSCGSWCGSGDAAEARRHVQTNQSEKRLPASRSAAHCWQELQCKLKHAQHKSAKAAVATSI